MAADTRGRGKNQELIDARKRLRSASGHPMEPQDVADEMNAFLWAQYLQQNQPGKRSRTPTILDHRYVSSYEAGRHYWPTKLYRAAWRHALRVETDAELGFTPKRRRQGTARRIPQASSTTVTDEVVEATDAGLPRAADDMRPGLAAGSASTDGARVQLDNERLTEIRRTLVATEQDDLDRTPILVGGPPVLAQILGSPALTLEDLDRFEAVVGKARDYSGEMLVAFLSECLEQCNIDDGTRGPRYALPSALGIVAVVSHKARTARSNSRRPLFGIGARAAEFTGWLYRDSGQSPAADYWRDRASEWAMEATDWAMPGYVLIKKSQSAWDERDAGRMLGLAEAVQEGPWRLPPRIMAEAVQQQARGLAMLNTGRRQVDEVLKRAEDLLGGVDERTALAAHYDSALFRLQKAICYGESARPEEAAEIYETTLTPTVFSTRDYAYFSTLKAQALVAAHRPDDAADTGSSALSAAFAAGSVRTVRELSRLRYRLEPWRGRPAVDSFMRLMQASD